MKILFTGGGTGGHFYPIIAIGQEIQELAKEYRLIVPELYFMSNSPYNEAMLYDNNIQFIRNSAGKRRMYFSFLNFFDLFKTGWGIITAIWSIFSIYPDVVFSKGGYASFPVLFAARILRIPVVIHESDTVPGRVNRWASKFAERIAVSFPDAVSSFPDKSVAVTGTPVRNEITQPMQSGAEEFLKLEKNVPVILVLGGSLGAQLINDVVIDALDNLLERFQIIHQTGKSNYQNVVTRTDGLLLGNSYKSRYKPFDYLNSAAMRMSAGKTDLVISRAGSTIFEIASWAKPSILIPITDSHGDHQRKNAYAYARSKACVVIEETNLTPHILIAEIDRIMTNEVEREEMSKAAKAFFKPDAAKIIAKGILAIALKHEI